MRNGNFRFPRGGVHVSQGGVRVLAPFLIRNYVPNWTTTPPAPTIAPTAVPIASTRLITHVEFEYSDRTSCGVFSNLDSCV